MMVVLVTVLFIFFLVVPLRLVSSGTLLPWPGLGLVCPSLVVWLALFSIFVLLFLMLGVTRLLLIFVGERVSGVVLSLTFMVLCSSLILLMFEEREKRTASYHYFWWCLERFPAGSCSWSACSMSVLWCS